MPGQEEHLAESRRSLKHEDGSHHIGRMYNVYPDERTLGRDHIIYIIPADPTSPLDVKALNDRSV